MYCGAVPDTCCSGSSGARSQQEEKKRYLSAHVETQTSYEDNNDEEAVQTRTWHKINKQLFFWSSFVLLEVYYLIFIANCISGGSGCISIVRLLVWFQKCIYDDLAHVSVYYFNSSIMKVQKTISNPICVAKWLVFQHLNNSCSWKHILWGTMGYYFVHCTGVTGPSQVIFFLKWLYNFEGTPELEPQLLTNTDLDHISLRLSPIKGCCNQMDTGNSYPLIITFIYTKL